MRHLNGLAGRLSRHRRPVAGAVLLLLGLVLTGSLYAAAPAQAGTADSNDELVAEGRELFLVGCATCHGQNGEGIETVNGNHLGPSLAGVGAAGRLPGRHRPDADVAAGPAEPGEGRGLQPGGDRRARGLRRQPGPRPGSARRG